MRKGGGCKGGLHRKVTFKLSLDGEPGIHQGKKRREGVQEVGTFHAQLNYGWVMGRQGEREAASFAGTSLV